MDEQRLPFPIHGTRLTGDGDPQRGVGEAARLLYFANLIAQTAGVPVYRLSRQTPYGQVTASVHGPLAFKTVHSVAEPEEPAPEEEAEAEAEEVTGITRLVWLPEGFVITPRTAGAPDGFGMPPTPDGKGTPGGPLKQVIINRFKDNQYPDAVYASVMRDNKQEPDEKITMIAAGLFYMDWEAVEGEFSIGVALKDEWKPQFKRRFETNFAEPETDKWYCHRPMYELGADKDFQKAARDITNLIREDAGRLPVGPALRGTEGGMSEMILYAMQKTEVQGHGSPLFPKGYEDLAARDARHAWSNADGENLATVPPTDGGADAANTFLDAWRHSPGHYANMVAEHFDTTSKYYGSVDVAMRKNMRITQHQLPPYDLDSPVEPVYPPLVGDSAAQMLQQANSFVSSALCGGDGLTGDRFGESTLNKPQGHCFMPLQYMTMPESTNGQAAVYFRGRTLIINEEDSTTFAVLAARIVRKQDEPEMLRIITADRTGEGVDKPVTITVREGLLCDFRKTQKALSEFVLPDDVGVTSTVRFSESGDKAVFCYTVAEPCLDTVVWTSRYNAFYVSPPNWTGPPIDNFYQERQDPVSKFWYPPRWDGYGESGDFYGEHPYSRPKLREFNEENSEQYIWGDVLHFMEWRDDSGWDEILTQSVDITPIGFQRLHEDHPDAGFFSGVNDSGNPPNHRRFDCKDSYKLFADYIGEEMVFAEVHVDSWFRSQHIGGARNYGDNVKSNGVKMGHSRLHRVLSGKFVFPDGTELVFRETKAGYDTRFGLDHDENQVSGFFLQFLYLDILRPETAVFVRQDLSGNVRPKAKSSIVSHGKVIKSIDDCLLRDYDDTFMQTHYTTELGDYGAVNAAEPEQVMAAIYDNASTWSGLIPYTISPPNLWQSEPITSFPEINYIPFHTASYYRVGDEAFEGIGVANVSFIGTGGQRFPPRGPYKAALVSHGLGNALTGRIRGSHPWWKTPHHELIGPEMSMALADQGQPYIEVALYKDEHIVAGDVGATLGQEKDAWQNDDRHFYDASIDLKAITGLPDLKDNIMPIGVL